MSPPATGPEIARAPGPGADALGAEAAFPAVAPAVARLSAASEGLRAGVSAVLLAERCDPEVLRTRRGTAITRASTTAAAASQPGNGRGVRRRRASSWI